MAGKSPAFRFYPSDFMGSPDVQAMDLHEVGAYIWMLCTAWQQDRHGCLPDDDRKLRAWARMTREQWEQSRELLLSKFPIIEPGIRGNPRMIAEAEKQLKFNQAQKDRINAAWERRRAATESIPTVQENLPTVEIGTPPVIPSVSVSVSVSGKGKKPSSSEVDQIYQAYPRKVGKGGALKAITKALMQVNFEDLLPKVQQYAKQRQREDPQFTPFPATWFNERRWEDEPVTTMPSQPRIVYADPEAMNA